MPERESSPADRVDRGGPSAAGENEDERVATEPWVRDLVRYLDQAVTIPGTDIGIGLDAVVGFFAPVIGDWVGAFASLILLGVALKRGVPPVIIGRMVLNVVVDTVLGMVPVAGDVFDVAFKSNKRNLALLERHASGEKPRALDYAVVGLAAFVVLLLAALPLVVTVLIVRAFTAS